MNQRVGRPVTSQQQRSGGMRSLCVSSRCSAVSRSNSQPPKSCKAGPNSSLKQQLRSPSSWRRLWFRARYTSSRRRHRQQIWKRCATSKVPRESARHLSSGETAREAAIEATKFLALLAAWNPETISNSSEKMPASELAGYRGCRDGSISRSKGYGLSAARGVRVCLICAESFRTQISKK